MQTNLVDALTKYEALARETAQNHAQLQSARQAMVDLLKAQEASYREGIRSVEAVVQGLGGVESAAQR